MLNLGYFNCPTSSNWYAAAAAAPKRDAGSCLHPNGFLHGDMGKRMTDLEVFNNRSWLLDELPLVVLKVGLPETRKPSGPCDLSNYSQSISAKHTFRDTHACPPTLPTLKHCLLACNRLQGEDLSTQTCAMLIRNACLFRLCILANKATQLH